MGFLDALWHLLNLFAPALGLAAIATALSKCLWWRQLRGVAWARLLGWSAAGATVALLGGLVLWGADGRMATYAAMVFATAVALAWAGFGGRRDA
ncbi:MULTISPECIES: hypothetical protein [Caldimonas]|uniref:hypothetical protein n=1 Tax=Caldimonas TaxID=196013 RepID=UPI000363F594|nr:MULTISPECIES: hypothetical protein [Caldimonas]GIX25544.1 MAG: hypothetical protein KatS3mg122_2775 [Caldimonas sp.]